ncbi:GNAT family N-acetyltransferase [Vibrio sp. CAIM 722]|uniref:GNAT family N-acetyltransferase n=1 Tax=Vibrio eleionomae TaxID=2653505 RepID=A0A7X4LKL4_9VIBR|nr:GNAT family N-acetyltransferase [Vibrio eleionomae]MZI93629.1 GNAT family N-acetyltransferase [Vibrio eleionomae]
MQIRNVTATDITAIVDIYNQYILNTVITFEEEIVDEQIMEMRIDKVLQTGLPWLVVEENGKLLGYAYAHLWRERSAYRFSVEPSIYLDPAATGKGLGKAIYQALLVLLKQLGKRNVIGVVTLPNVASERLHESLGFKKVGEFEHVGYKHERWLSVGYYQLTFPEHLHDH